jgi:phage gp46-like protein
MYAPDTNYGSTFNNVRKRTSNSRTLLRQVAEKALQPLIDDRRAVTIDVENTDNARHAEALDVTITEREGSVTSFSFNPLGS